MQSHQDTFGAETTKRYGHRRTPTLGKAMPVTSLLLNFPPPTMSSMRNSCMRDGRTPDEERPPLFFQLEPSSYSSHHNHAAEKEASTNNNDDANSSSDELNLEKEYDLLVSECSSNGDDDASHNEHAISIVGNSVFYTPCMTCTDSAPGDMGARATAINEMCRRLCTDECRLRLSLAGLEPPSTVALKSQEALAEYVEETCLQQKPQLQHTFSADTMCADSMDEQKARGVDEVDRVAVIVGKPITLPKHLVTSAITAYTPTNSMRPPSCIAIQRKKFLTDILTGNTNDTDSDSSFVDEPKEKADDDTKKFIHFVNNLGKPARDLADGTTSNKPDVDGYAHSLNDKATNAPVVDQHEMAMLKDFREKFAIAEALAKTSAMTSTVQMKQRLAARQLEITNANANAAKAAAAAALAGNVTAYAFDAEAVANKDDCVSPTKKQKAKQETHRHRRRGEQHKKRQQQTQQKGVPPTHNALTHSNNNNAFHSIDVNSRIDNNNDKHNNCYDASAERRSDYNENVHSEGYERDHDDDDDENGSDSDCDCDRDCDCDSDNDDEFDIVDADNVATRKQQQQQENFVNDYEPPRDLLLYLVR